MKKTLLLLLFTLLLSSWSGIHAQEAVPGILEETWKEFRQIHPFGYQAVALKHYGDTCVIIISEPAEKVKPDMLSGLFHNYGGSMIIRRQPLGYGGWLADAAGYITGADSTLFKEFTHHLFCTLYGTDYKAQYLDLDNPVKHTYFSPYRLNYSISASELTKWFITDGEPFIADKGATKTITALLNANLKETNTLYYSQTPGFIVWTIQPDKIDKNDALFQLNARKFALDADLIIGALGQKGNKIAIIARQRIVPTEVLPPLRIETLLLLATTENDHLAQSFERNSIFAGRNKSQQDLAPILLSEELWHTEYGNLLNITDQMLKGWSENGYVNYFQFDHPKPIDWAFNAGAYYDIVGWSNGQSLTYNWNTAGAGYVIQDANQWDVFAVNRTGSLPVSYIPSGMEGKADEKVYDAEELAYDFFAELNSPELVREVQYATFYQIFHYFRMPKEKELPKYHPIWGFSSLPAKIDLIPPIAPVRIHARDVAPLVSVVENLLHMAHDRDSAGFNDQYEQGYTRYAQRAADKGAWKKHLQQLIADDPYQHFQGHLQDEYGRFVVYSWLNESSLLNDDKRTYDNILFPALDTIDTYIRRYEQATKSPFLYNEIACWLVDREQEMSYQKAIRKLQLQEASIIYQYNDTVDKYNAKVKAKKATIIDQFFVEEAMRRMDSDLKDIKGQIESIENNLSLLIPSASVQDALGAANWLLTDPKHFDAPIGDFYAANIKSSARWMKSSPIACSTHSRALYGGHNLDATVTPVKVSRTSGIAKGYCKITSDAGQKIISVNAADKARITPDVLRTIERRIALSDKPQTIALPPSPAVRPKTILTGETEKLALVDGTPVKSISSLREQIATDIAQNGTSSVKEIHFTDFTAREVHMFADNLRETIVERIPEETTNLKNFDINEDIQVISQSDGTVKLVLQQRPETLPSDKNLKAATLEISVPESVAGSLKEAVLKIFKKSENMINNRFKWKRELRRELQQTHPEIDSYDIKDELNHIYGKLIKRNEYETIYQLAA